MRKEDNAAPETEENTQNIKKEPRFRPAELIAFAVAAVFIAAVIFINLYNFNPGELILEAKSSPASITETKMIVNINTADAKELMKLDGIGEALAGRIIDYRNEHGDFETIWDITKVRGISEKTFERIYPHITV